MKSPQLFLPTTRPDVLRRSAVRIGLCAVPYLVLAWLWSAYRDDRLFHGWGFWLCVVAIPLLGLVVDLWRLRQTRNRDNPAAP